jgi:hypothetical protein
MVLMPNAFDQWKHTQDSIDASKNKVEAKAKATTNSKSTKKANCRLNYYIYCSKT